jgi:hypothetical protein
VAAQIAMLSFDPKDHQATSQSVVFQVAGVAYLLGFIGLLFTAIGAQRWLSACAGRFGGIAAGSAVVGTMLLGGDLWFETFAVPWLADGPAPQVLDSDPSTLLGLGAVSSYVSFALGWALVGVASYRSRAVPKVIAAAVAVGGVLGFSALLAPFGLPLGFAIAALGIWTMRNNARARSASPSAL